MCFSPFFPRVLIHLVALDNPIGQRRTIPRLGGLLLKPVTQCQQLAAIALQFAGQLAGADALCNPPQDQHQLRTGALRAVQNSPGEAVEHPPASATLVINHRRPMATVDAQTIHRPATWADQAPAMQQEQEFVVACLFIHEVLNWEIHRLLRERRNYFAPAHALAQQRKAPRWRHEPNVRCSASDF